MGWRDRVFNGLEGEARGLSHKKEKQLQGQWLGISRFNGLKWAVAPQEALATGISGLPHPGSLTEEFDPACDTPSSRCSPCQANFIMTSDRRPQECREALTAVSQEPGLFRQESRQGYSSRGSKCRVKKRKAALGPSMAQQEKSMRPRSISSTTCMHKGRGQDKGTREKDGDTWIPDMGTCRRSCKLDST